MIDQTVLQQWVQRILSRASEAGLGNQKASLYPQPNEKFADMELDIYYDWFFKKKLKTVMIIYTLKPDGGESWTGFSFEITKPLEAPRVNASVWPETGGEQTMSDADTQAQVANINEVLSLPLASNNQKPPREAPESMY